MHRGGQRVPAASGTVFSNMMSCTLATGCQQRAPFRPAWQQSSFRLTGQKSPNWGFRFWAVSLIRPHSADFFFNVWYLNHQYSFRKCDSLGYISSRDGRPFHAPMLRSHYMRAWYSLRCHWSRSPRPPQNISAARCHSTLVPLDCSFGAVPLCFKFLRRLSNKILFFPSSLFFSSSSNTSLWSPLLQQPSTIFSPPPPPHPESPNFFLNVKSHTSTYPISASFLISFSSLFLGPHSRSIIGLILLFLV